MKILAVGAHPDDVAIGCGGTLALAAQAGFQVLAVIMTRGSRRGDPNLRANESKAGAKALGVELVLADLIDGEVDKADVDAFLEPIVAGFDPDTVFTHSASDSHPDHMAVHVGAVAAARHVSSVLCFESPSALEFRPNVYVDVTATIDVKRAAIACHRSQLIPGGRVGDDITLAKARVYGYDCRAEYAEAFASPRLLWDIARILEDRRDAEDPQGTAQQTSQGYANA